MAESADLATGSVIDEAPIEAPPRPAARLGALISLGLAGLLIVGLGWFGVSHAVSLHDTDSLNRDRRNAELAARQVVLALTTLSAKSSTSDIARLEAGLTPTFRSTFKEQTGDLAKTLVQANVTSTGTIASAGIVSLRKGSAVVLVAAGGNVTNKSATSAESRSYRMRVSLQDVKGRWLVSDLEFAS